MRFASLGSGSGGNATLVEAGSTLVMVDCGFSCAEAERRMARLGRQPCELAAVVVTHEHGDHVRGVCAFARRHRIPVWMTPGTRLAFHAREPCECCLHDGSAPVALGDMQFIPYTVPHDAREPCQYVFDDGARRFGLLTDAGMITPHIAGTLEGCDALMLECNHDADLLAGGPYPARLKERVGGRLGHLSNGQAAGMLLGMDCTRLQHVVAAHLSAHNNRPDLARAALGESLNCSPGWIAVADQDAGLGWRQIV
jgi:phosphoribosyl 1,2-cyclic phosphodiesterase